MGNKICPVCQMTLENEYGDCMCLPEENTCDDCQNFERCKALGVAKEGQGTCDWFPIRFKERSSKMSFRDTVILALNSYKEGLATREEAAAMVNAAVPSCRECGVKEGLKMALATIELAMDNCIKPEITE